MYVEAVLCMPMCNTTRVIALNPSSPWLIVARLCRAIEGLHGLFRQSAYDLVVT